MIYYQAHRNQDSNEWVTFVHGAGGSSRIWVRQIEFFKKLFNVIELDLRGHGNSKDSHHNIKRYDFCSITEDIVKILDNEKIEKTHFIGISLGSLIIRNLINMHPERCKSAVLGGMIVRINPLSKVLLIAATLAKNIIPIQLLYSILANVLLPKRSHSHSKSKFIKEAKKLSRKEFLKWFELTKELKSLFLSFKNSSNVPMMVIQGKEDYLFIKDVKNYVKKQAGMLLKIIPECGHVVNIQASSKFNDLASKFIFSHKNKE